ncbi:hypothetical protein F4859DRAFT_69720 [Xylaria cf. heliscus]|nr:hypothetical protein F4859DRAFT_69720 [Xylaria cf. heliscus]
MSFSKFTCVQCTRRLSRLAQSSTSSSNPLLRQATTSQCSPAYTPLSSTRHLTTSSRRAAARAVLTPNTFARVRFTREDIPPREYWEAKANVPNPIAKDVSADECFRAAQAYAHAALKDAPGWREKLITTADRSPDEEERTLSAYTLHYVAVTIIVGGGGPAAHLATHILHTLTGLDYVPSILTMVRMALQRKVHGQPQFEHAVQGLERTLRRIGDGSSSSRSSSNNNIDLAADACTLRALLHMEQNTREGDNDALRWFRRAYEIGGTTSTTTPPKANQPQNEADAASKGSEGAPFDPYWQWKASFALGVAAIRLKRGELDKAADMYELASSGLDSAAGYAKLAAVLERRGEADTDRYLEALEKAAASGDKDAARRMGMRAWHRAEEAGLSKREKRRRQVVAEEWMAVAGDMVPAEA